MTWFYASIRHPEGHTSGSVIESTSIDHARRTANGRARRMGADVMSIEPYDKEKHGQARPCCVSRG